MAMRGLPLLTWRGIVKFPFLWTWAILCSCFDHCNEQKWHSGAFKRTPQETCQLLLPLRGRQPSHDKEARLRLRMTRHRMERQGHLESPISPAMSMKPFWTFLHVYSASWFKWLGTSAHIMGSRIAQKNLLDLTKNWWKVINHCCFKPLNLEIFFLYEAVYKWNCSLFCLNIWINQKAIKVLDDRTPYQTNEHF